jgi:hypothetical protein
LSCLLCGDDFTDLVQVQEHGMDTHAITRDDLRLAMRHGPVQVTTDTGSSELCLESYTWTLPDGREWLRASRTMSG